MPSSYDLASIKRIVTKPHSTTTKETLELIEFVDMNKVFFKKNRVLLAPPYAAYVWSKSFEISKLPFWGGYFEFISEEI